jgi:hypothetical protein
LLIVQQASATWIIWHLISGPFVKLMLFFINSRETPDHFSSPSVNALPQHQNQPAGMGIAIRE